MLGAAVAQCYKGGSSMLVGRWLIARRSGG
jgi:hypothetical protein